MSSFAGDEQDFVPGLPPQVEVVNLTPHSVTLHAQPAPHTDDEAVGERLVVLPQPVPVQPGTPVVTPARVVDEELPPTGQVIHVQDALVPLVRLRRGSAVTGLPRPKAGRLYVVSRLTALAATRRDDLVFPHGELRDAAQNIDGVQALAAFTPRWSPMVWWRDHRATRLARRARRSLPADWFTAMLFSVGITLLSGAVGLLPGMIDAWRASGFGGENDQVLWTAISSIALGVIGVVVLAWAIWRWRERQRTLDARGTAYIIEEQATYWVHEEKVSTLRVIAANFAQVLRVPGPAALDPAWAWSTGAERLGYWDQRVNELVSAFRAVHFNDDQVSHNAVFLWAPWPVALAFGTRVTAGVRGLTLHVRQRPSFGTSAAPRPVVLVEDLPHDFQQADAAELVNLDRHEVLPTRRGTITVHLTCADSIVRPQSGDAPPLRLLMVGVNADVFAGLTPCWAGRADSEGSTPHGDPSPTATIHAPAEIAHLLPERIEDVPCARWHLAPMTSTAAAIPDLEWNHFPAVADAIAAWIRHETAKSPEAVHLLACRAPQELLLGVGIISSQPTFGKAPWPARLYPVMYADHHWSIPNVRLGTKE